MFILRRITAKGGEINTNLGDYYTLFLKDSSPEGFNQTTKLWSEEDVNDLYGVICFGENGESIMPLYLGSKYYIMTGDGQTFDNISKK